MLQAHAAGMSYTILRPVSFMDNMAPDLHGKGFATMWANVVGSRPLQLVSAKDIGVFAAKALMEPASPAFHNKALSLAGEELTQAQASKVFEKVYGKPMPNTLCGWEVGAVADSGVEEYVPVVCEGGVWGAGRGVSTVVPEVAGF